MIKINYENIEDMKKEYVNLIFKEDKLKKKVEIENINYTYKEILTFDFKELVKIYIDFKVIRESYSMSRKYNEFYNILQDNTFNIEKLSSESEKIYKSLFTVVQHVIIKHKLDDKIKNLEDQFKENKSKIDKLKKIKNKLNNLFSNEEKSKFIQIFNYKAKREKISNFFMKYSKSLNIKTCFYCNIDYVYIFKDINVDEDDVGEKNLFTLDHVIDKAFFPIFALSLFNFVPSCYACNSKFKRDNKLITNEISSRLSPSSKDFDVNEKIKFKIRQNGEKQEFYMDIEDRENEIYEKYIETFKLNGRYNYFEDEVNDIKNKFKTYSDSVIEQLVQDNKNIRGNIISKNLLKNDIFGENVLSNDIYKVPLTKLKRDIYKWLEGEKEL